MEKRNLKLTLSLAIAALVAIALLVIGYVVSGADILAWLGSKYAITIYIALGLFGIAALFAYLRERNRRL